MVNKVVETDRVTTIHFKVPLRNLKTRSGEKTDKENSQWKIFDSFTRRRYAKHLTVIGGSECTIVGDCEESIFPEIKRAIEEMLEQVPDIFED